MCGIAGKIFTDPGRPVNRTTIERMVRTLAHRGPDGEGIFAEGAAMLGHRRLSVIDLSNRAAQPMVSANGRYVIVFNGEIYNFGEIGSELRRRGTEFRSNSDTEVLLEAFATWGPECLGRLAGMFAFAVWDRRERVLFAARDRVGKKPLFYRATPDAFWFASEAKAILADPDVPRTVSLEAIHHYLTYQCVPAPFCAFEGLKKLPPAHFLEVRQGEVRTSRYWRLQFAPKWDVSRRSKVIELQDRLVGAVREAVRLRLVSDVPLGAFLSGGVDSSSIVALMAQEAGRTVRTFSIRFEESGFDESAFARRVAERWGTDHTELTVRPEAASVLPRLAWHYDEPFADSSAVPTYYVSRLAREHVTVALNGDGGDELFGGYERYIANDLARAYRLLPSALRGRLTAFAARLPRGGSVNSPTYAFAKFLEIANNDPFTTNLLMLCYFDNGMKASLFEPEVARRLEGLDSYELLRARVAAGDAVDVRDRAMCGDVELYLPDDLLVKVDIASMAHGLEARSPLLDHRVMEIAARIPPEHKVLGPMTKRLFKAAFRRLLPWRVRHRRKKGFGVPIERWLGHELRPLAEELLLGERARARGYFAPASVRRLFDDHLEKRRNNSYRIWALMMLELWHRTWIDPPIAPEAPAS
ncbi:MAG: asparagine synthase (glutamine-hydrolyzing) [Myxococcales bacterium]|nr:asparagine synthase (glutamine-hydrolyzing) [Myxococcales bacterium]